MEILFGMERNQGIARALSKLNRLMNPNKEFPRIAVMGAGAVGSFFGGMLARAGAPVTLIGRASHAEAISAGGLIVESFRFPKPERIQVEAATSVEAVRGAQIVLLCVKTLDTESAAQAMAPHLAPGAVVVSMQNGVDNVARIRAASGIDALAAAVYVAAEMPAPGHVKHTGRGDLIVGPFPHSNHEPAAVERLAQCFVRAGMPCRVAEDIRGLLWMKMLMNCAYNAISALGHSRYGRMAARAEIREIMRNAIEEAVAVARADGKPLPVANFVETGWKLAETMGNATSSTAQDLARGKKTEIDSLNGYIVRRGLASGVATPVNQTLHGLIKLLEDSAGA
jgi:2-dehydropantoate 2-reductase